MEEIQVEYLDYKKPKRNGTQVQRSVPQIKQEIASLLQNYFEKAGQKHQRKILQYKASLLIELETHKIITKVGNYKQQQADAIILPYSSSQLFYYPAKEFQEQVIKTDKQKIKGLNVQTSKLYLRSKKLFNYKYRAFIKTQKENAAKDIIDGIDSLIKLAIQKQIPFTTIAIIFNKELFNLEQLFDSLVHFQIPKRERLFTLMLVLPSRQQLTNVFKVLK